LQSPQYVDTHCHRDEEEEEDEGAAHLYIIPLCLIVCDLSLSISKGSLFRFTALYRNRNTLSIYI
jgi:hypothetical protein